MKLTPARLRMIRIAAGLSQTQLAALVTVNRSTIAKYESSERGLSPEIERRLILALGWHDPELQDVLASVQRWKEATIWLKP